MQIRKVAEPFKELSGQPVKCISLAEAIAEQSDPEPVISLCDHRKKKQAQQRASANDALDVK
jgi:hypothetical protein